MENVNIKLDNGSGREFDLRMAENRSEGLPQASNLEVVTKWDGTQQGNTIVMLTFHVEIDGKPKRVQAVTTAKLFIAAADAVRGGEQFKNAPHFPVN